MSSTTHSSTATLTLANVNSDSDALKLLTDWLGNNPDEIPDGLSQDGTADELADELAPYIEVGENGFVTVTLDTEGEHGNFHSEVFDFITAHFASIQTSPYMTVHWANYCSRSGMSSGTTYYDKDLDSFESNDAAADSHAMNRIAALLSGSEWDADLMAQVAEIVRGTGREVGDLA